MTMRDAAQFRYGIAILLMGVSLQLSLGCSDGGPDTAPVIGKVTLDGKPLENVSVLFQPVGDTTKRELGVGSYGVTDAQGNFTLKLSNSDRPGAVVGTHAVTIVEKTPAGNEDDDAGGAEEGALAPVSRIPAEYGNGMLKFDVKRDVKNTADFEMKSSAKFHSSRVFYSAALSLQIAECSPGLLPHAPTPGSGLVAPPGPDCIVL